jgi:hypothetical protein
VIRWKLASLVVALGASTATMLFAGQAGSAVRRIEANTRAPALYKNCTNLNKKYPHGVGKVGARDRSKSGDPVTNFRRSNKIYKTAMSWNQGLDRDKDGVACEQA